MHASRFPAPPVRRFRMTPALLLVALSAAATLRAQAPTPDPASAAPVYVQPTVTAEMGDVGGRYFGHPPDPLRTRHYYIAAEPELWNFAPDGQDPICGKPFPPALLLNRAGWKIRYVQYADASFSARVLPSERLGILGPILRGVTGDTIEVTFLNRSWRPLSMHPHGVKYDKDSEGTFYKSGSGMGAAVAPGAKFTYVWKLDEASAPLADEPSSKAWLYHSHVTGDEEVNLGLIGAIIVTDPARARADGTPRDVDREMAALFLIFNEGNTAGAAEDTDDLPVKPSGPVAQQIPTWAEAQKAAEEGQRHTINGRAFGNLPGLEMNEGEHVRWYLFGLGSESDMHSAHWHGARVIEDGRRRTDVVELSPASMKVADMVADNPGQWLFHCHVAEHMVNGMFARFTVYPANGPGVSREPEVAFFGMPQSLNTLRLQSALLSSGAPGSTGGEIQIVGEVTVPSPFIARKNAFVVQVGAKSVTLQPDTSGLCVSPEAVLLIKNISSIGVVTGGTLNFELTLKGDAWMDALRKASGSPHGDTTPTGGMTLPVTLLVGGARHSAVGVLKTAE